MIVNGIVNRKKLKLKVCEDFFSKAFGLMFCRRLKDNEALLIPLDKETRCAVHTLFVFFQLKIAFLDKKMKVIEVRKAYPFISYIISKKRVKYVLELNKDFKVKIGDKLSLVA